jgi:hypothetical protein
MMVRMIKESIVKTRKPHKCHGCCTEIKVGQTAKAQTNIDGRHVYTLYYCVKCRDWCKNCTECIDWELAYEGYIGECMREKGDV